MMIRARTATLALTFLLVCASITYADFAFEVRQNGVSGNSFNVAAGGAITIDIYLTESNGENRLSTFGLLGSYIGLQYDNLDPANAYVLSAMPSGNDFIISDDTAYGWEVGSGYDPNTSPPVGSELLIATVVAKAGLAGNSTTFSIVDPNAGGDVVLNNFDIDDPFNSFTELDSFVFSSPLQFTINTGPTAVPEPTSLAMVVVAGGGALIAKARRKKKLSKV